MRGLKDGVEERGMESDAALPVPHSSPGESEDAPLSSPLDLIRDGRISASGGGESLGAEACALSSSKADAFSQASFESFSAEPLSLDTSALSPSAVFEDAADPCQIDDAGENDGGMGSGAFSLHRGGCRPARDTVPEAGIPLGEIPRAEYIDAEDGTPGGYRRAYSLSRQGMERMVRVAQAREAFVPPVNLRRGDGRSEAGRPETKGSFLGTLVGVFVAGIVTIVVLGMHRPFDAAAESADRTLVRGQGSEGASIPLAHGGRAANVPVSPEASGRSAGAKRDIATDASVRGADATLQASVKAAVDRQDDGKGGVRRDRSHGRDGRGEGQLAEQLSTLIEDGRVALADLDYGAAQGAFEQALMLSRRLHKMDTIAWVEATLADVYLNRGELIMKDPIITARDCARAAAFFRDALRFEPESDRLKADVRSASVCTNRRLR